MNLIGGYIMLDLDDTSDLLNRVKKVYATGKPLVVKYKDRLQFADFVERASSSADFKITLSDNTLLSIHYFSGALSQTTTILPVKRHTIVLSLSISTTTHKISFELLSTSPHAYSSTANLLQAIYNAKHIAEESGLLVNDNVSGFSNIYTEFLVVGGTYRLHVKPSGASTYTELTATNITLVSDEVTTI